MATLQVVFKMTAPAVVIRSSDGVQGSIIFSSITIMQGGDILLPRHCLCGKENEFGDLQGSEKALIIAAGRKMAVSRIHGREMSGSAASIGGLDEMILYGAKDPGAKFNAGPAANIRVDETGRVVAWNSTPVATTGTLHGARSKSETVLITHGEGESCKEGNSGAAAVFTAKDTVMIGCHVGKTFQGEGVIGTLKTGTSPHLVISEIKAETEAARMLDALAGQLCRQEHLLSCACEGPLA